MINLKELKGYILEHFEKRMK